MNERGGSEAVRQTETRGILLALALLAVAMLPALQPLLTSQLTCGYDNTFHLWRAVQIDHLWNQGVLYSRWAPDMAHGFGFPLYLFASPFPPGLVALLHRTGIAWPAALNAVFALGVAIGAYGMFWLAYRLMRNERGGRDGTGALAAGLIAAVAYVYAPFQAYDLFNRGSLWESFAWVFPPLLLLGVHQWCLYKDRRYLLLGAGALGAMVLSHHVFAFLFGPVFALWIVVHAVQRRDWAVLGRGLVLSALGLGLTAFFWMPPFLEKSLVQADRLLNTWVFDYHHNFLLVEHLLALPRRADPRLLNDWPEKALGLVPVLLALLPLTGWRRSSKAMRWRLGLLWGLIAAFVVLMLPVSRWLWDRVSLLAYVQFPWRYLGPAAFCVALLTGLGAADLWEAAQASKRGPGRSPVARSWWAALLPAGVLAITITANLGWFYPRHCDAVTDTSMASLIGWERVTDTLGTTAKGEYLPKWVERFPDETLDTQYAAGGPIVRLAPESLPEGARIESADYGATRAILALVTPEPFVARYLAFYYPGWHVTVDGRAVLVSPEPRTGLVTFEVPAGAHTIEIRFGETPMRLVANAISVLSLLGLGVMMGIARSKTIEGPRARRLLSDGRRWAPETPLLAVLAVALALVFLVRWGVERQGYLWRSSRLTVERTVTGLGPASRGRLPAPANFDHQALLLGLGPLPDQAAADAETLLTLYWRALAPTARDWRVGLALIAEDDPEAGAAGRWIVELRPARWARSAPPLIEWSPDDYARMDLHMDFPPGMPPGRYEMQLALFDRATAVPASVLDANGNPLGPALSLGSITVAPPAAAPSLESLGVNPGLEDDARAMRSCEPVGLWHAAPDRKAAAPGEGLVMRTVWEALAVPDEALEMQVQLLDAAGDIRRQWDRPLVTAAWPTTAWSPGERWVGRAELRLPGSLETGAYTLTLGLDTCALGAWSLAVTAPERLWELPAGFVAPGDTLGADAVTLGESGRPLVRLAGLRIDRSGGPDDPWQPGDAIDLTLAWEALTEIPVSYRVFVHLLDEKGNLLDQSDGEPVAWTRPTTGWATGEIVIDRRPLALPASTGSGTYILRTGLYGPDGVRLAALSGEDGILLAEVAVGP